jgi:hypothetical protein
MYEGSFSTRFSDLPVSTDSLVCAESGSAGVGLRFASSVSIDPLQLINVMVSSIAMILNFRRVRLHSERKFPLSSGFSRISIWRYFFRSRPNRSRRVTKKEKCQMKPNTKAEIRNCCSTDCSFRARTAPSPNLRQENIEYRSGIFRTSVGGHPSILSAPVPKKACGFFHLRSICTSESLL